ncbi:MAG: hypothetical protein IT377_34055 [Polyangiaceae bacterium]|nr:hypothetical protein [Polyangiaceae bacterium]
MTDPVSAARTARESLARGLSVLQSPGVPAGVMDVAEPIAMAMGALHKIEATQGGALAEQATLALDAARRGLSMLQGSAGQHPAVDQAMEAVAGSLGTIHSLVQAPPRAGAATVPAVPNALAGTLVMQPGQPPQPAYQQAAPQPQAAHPQAAYAPTAPQPQAAYQPPPQPQAAPQAAYPQAAPQPQAAYPQAAYPQAAPQPAYAAQQFPPGGYGAPPPAAQGAPWAGQPPAAPQPQAAQAAWQQPPAAAPALGSSPVAAGAQVPGVQAPPNVPRMEADLGAHSPSNFYKGLSGNDVIDSGGLFVATYKIPKIGSNVVIKVALPGGYEFEALAVVEWIREAPNSTAGVEAPPGFGAKFTQISPEGRQLVYRYVRNREPLFHDDL